MIAADTITDVSIYLYMCVYTCEYQHIYIISAGFFEVCGLILMGRLWITINKLTLKQAKLNFGKLHALINSKNRRTRLGAKNNCMAA